MQCLNYLFHYCLIRKTFELNWRARIELSSKKAIKLLNMSSWMIVSRKEVQKWTSSASSNIFGLRLWEVNFLFIKIHHFFLRLVGPSRNNLTLSSNCLWSIVALSSVRYSTASYLLNRSNLYSLCCFFIYFDSFWPLISFSRRIIF